MPQEDTRNAAKSPRSLTGLLPFIRPYRGRVALALLFLVLAAMSTLAFPLALILFLPIPFGNIPPAAAIACLALGLAERDGLAVIVGYVLSAASVAILAAVSSALYAGVVAFFHALFGV